MTVTCRRVTVENNGLLAVKPCLAVKPKTNKLTYAETVRLTTAVEKQNCLIGKGGDPIDELVNIDIKKK